MAIKTSLPHLDEADQKTKSTSRKIDQETSGPEKPTPKSIQVQFRKRETEEQLVARLSSYAHLQRQLEEESWVEMTHYHPNSNESATVYERLLSLTPSATANNVDTLSES